LRGDGSHIGSVLTSRASKFRFAGRRAARPAPLDGHGKAVAPLPDSKCMPCQFLAPCETSRLFHL